MTSSHKLELPASVAQGVLAGEHSAISEAYHLLGQRVMNLATRILRDRGQAEEVVQDTFIELVEKSTQIRDASAIPAWVKRVAVNHCLMRLRSPWHARRVDVEAEVLDESQQQDDTENTLDWVVNVPTLEGALNHLSEDARTVLWLHDVEGYTHKEIGQKMGRTTSFSKSQLARAYEKLLQWRRAHAETASTGQKTDVPPVNNDEKTSEGLRRETSRRNLTQPNETLLKSKSRTCVSSSDSRTQETQLRSVVSQNTTQVKNEDEKNRINAVRTTDFTPTFST